MKNFDSRTYSINDFREWNERQQLELAPRFQRRDVWTDKARSFLMDTILRGKPIPKIFIRQLIDPSTKRTVREVVDGQQRLRTILKYLGDGFVVSKVHNSDYGGDLYSELPEEVQKSLLSYEISVDLLLDAQDKDVLDIFARLNTYSATLTRQELLNSKYFGAFKQTAYALAMEFLSFWTKHRILSDRAILRMEEAELTSELLITLVRGIHSNKMIEKYYKEFDDHLPRASTVISRFKSTMDHIGEMLGDTLSTSVFRRVPLFYTLFTSIAHMQYGVKNVKTKRAVIKKSDYPKIVSALEKVDALYAKAADDRTKEEEAFFTSAKLATTDASSRTSRTEYVCKLILHSLRARL